MKRNSLLIATVFFSACLLGLLAAHAEEVVEKGIPTELKGFKGMMTGTLVGKGEDSCTFRIGAIVKVWKGNAAENPKESVGKTVILSLKKIPPHHGERVLANYREAKPGDAVELEAFDLGEKTLCILEYFRRKPAE